MSSRLRVLAFVAVVLVVGIGAGAFALSQRADSQKQRETEPTAQQASPAALQDQPRIVFRHTGLDSSYGVVAMVPLTDPSRARAFTDIACDRVAAWSGGASCLAIERGVVTKYETRLLGPDWQVQRTWPLPGIPSRTRVSPDGTVLAATSFVNGHSYMTTGFSTVTEVHAIDGSQDWDNLEDFALTIEARKVNPTDLNVWGVTFADDETFYATVATGGRTWLAKGDITERTLTSVTSGAECPAISPDRSQVAFKVDVEPGTATVWGLAVLDLDSGKRTVLEGGPRGVDDQVEWLDDDTLLYGLPRAEEAGVTDVWSLDTTPDAQPELLIEQAWSPTVVR